MGREGRDDWHRRFHDIEDRERVLQDRANLLLKVTGAIFVVGIIVIGLLVLLERQRTPEHSVQDAVARPETQEESPPLLSNESEDIREPPQDFAQVIPANPEPAEARGDSTEAITPDPEPADVYFKLGLAYHRHGDYDRAVTEYREAIRLKPDFPKAYYNRAIAHYRRGSYGGAITDFSEAIRLKKDYALAYYSRGAVYGNMGDLDGAIADFNTAIRLNPEKPEAYRARGLAYRMKGEAARAAADFAKARKLGWRPK